MKLNKEHSDLVIKLSTLFYFCSIVGYLYELILNFFYSGKLFSHGILYGPWLPIYGLGALVISALHRFRKNPFIIFFGSFFLTGTLEYLIGLVLLKVLHIRLWDYTGYLLNIDGLVCLLSAACFAVGGLLVTYLIYPFIEKICTLKNKRLIKIILSLLSVAFLTDIIATILK